MWGKLRSLCVMNRWQDPVWFQQMWHENFSVTFRLRVLWASEENINSTKGSAQFRWPMENTIFKVCILQCCLKIVFHMLQLLWGPVMGLAMDTITPFCSTSAIDRTSDSNKALGLLSNKMEMSHWFTPLSLSLLFSPCRPILLALWPRSNLQSWLFVGQSKMVPLAWCVLDTCAYLWVFNHNPN